MIKMLEIREKLMLFYRNFEYIIQTGAKFVLALLAFGYLNSELGYFSALTGIIPTVFLALICAVVPISVFVLIFALVILLHLFKLSMMLAVIGAVIFLLFYFVYLRFAPEHGILIILYPVLAQFNLQYMLPLIGAMAFNPFAAVPIAFSVVFMKIVEYIQAAAEMGVVKEDIQGIMSSYQFVFDKLFADKEMVAYIIVFTLVILIVYGISRLSMDYSWYLAIVVGSLVNIIGLAFQASAIESVNVVMVVVGSVIGGLIAMAGVFMSGVLDYSRRESLQFEDDDYYYYVKAIPKIKVSDEESGKREQKSRKNKKQKKAVAEVEEPVQNRQDPMMADTQEIHFERPVEKKERAKELRNREEKTEDYFEDIDFEEFDFDDVDQD